MLSRASPKACETSRVHPFELLAHTTTGGSVTHSEGSAIRSLRMPRYMTVERESNATPPTLRSQTNLALQSPQPRVAEASPEFELSISQGECFAIV